MLENTKKHGPGKKSSKQHHDENAQKDIALGTQNPIETYILGQNSKDTGQKEQGGKAALQTTFL